MSNSYSSFCDDFYLDMYIGTELELPSQRDTVLTFFERIQKQFSSMCCFYRRDDGTFCLEENRSTGQYRWVTLETDRIGSGMVNPSSLEQAYIQDRLVLELAPYMLSVSHLDISWLDVTLGMYFDFTGSSDEVIAEALFGSSAFNCLFDMPGAKPIGLSPAVVVAISEDCRTQARISVEPKARIYEPEEMGEVAGEGVGLSFTIRQYPSSTKKFDALKSFEYQCRLGEEFMSEKISS